MPQRSAISQLPQSVQDDLNARLIANGFSDYNGLAVWLADQGYEISKSQVHRHGQNLQADFEEAMADVRRATALARAWAKTDEDERGDLLDTTARMLQEHLLRLTLELRKMDKDPTDVAPVVAKVTRAISDLGRMTISHKKWIGEVREKAQVAANEVAKVARKGGLSDEAIRAIEEQVLGIA